MQVLRGSLDRWRKQVLNGILWILYRKYPVNKVFLEHHCDIPCAVADVHQFPVDKAQVNSVGVSTLYKKILPLRVAMHQTFELPDWLQGAQARLQARIASDGGRNFRTDLSKSV